MNWQDVISIAVVPVVIISACGVLCLAFYNRLSQVVGRLRTLQRERLIAEREKHPEILAVFTEQNAVMFHRASLVRRILQSLLGAIASEVLSSLAMGISAIFPGQGIDHVGVALFTLGLLLILLAVVFAFWEVKIALHAAAFEKDALADILGKETE